MSGSMRQRSAGAWELRVHAGKDPITGKVRYVSKTFRGGKREAQRELAKLVTQHGGPQQVATNATVGELLDLWFAHAGPDLSPSTQVSTNNIVELYLRPHLGDVPLSQLTTVRIDAFYRTLLAKGGRNGKKLSPATVRRTHVVLRRALVQAVRWGYIPHNPAAEATPPRVLVKDITPPSPGEVVRLYDLACETNPALAAYLLVSAATGARRSEVCGLRWDHVDLDAGTVLINRGIVLGPDGNVEKDTKTHQARRIAIDPHTVGILRTHRAAAEAAAADYGVGLRPDGFVFSNEPDGGIHWSPEYPTHAFSKLRAKAGLPKLRLHDLRHYVATRLLSGGIDVRTVAGRLGHRNASTTLNVYAAFLPESDRAAADTLASLFAAARDEVPPPAGSASE